MLVKLISEYGVKSFKLLGVVPTEKQQHTVGLLGYQKLCGPLRKGRGAAYPS